MCSSRSVLLHTPGRFSSMIHLPHKSEANPTRAADHQCTQILRHHLPHKSKDSEPNPTFSRSVLHPDSHASSSTQIWRFWNVNPTQHAVDQCTASSSSTAANSDLLFCPLMDSAECNIISRKLQQDDDDDQGRILNYTLVVNNDDCGVTSSGDATINKIHWVVCPNHFVAVLLHT